MPGLYNTTLYENMTNVYMVFNASNQMTNGTLSLLILLGLYLILIMTLRHFGMANATTATGLIVTFIAFMFYWANLVHMWVVFTCFIFFMAGLMFKAFSEN